MPRSSRKTRTSTLLNTAARKQGRNKLKVLASKPFRVTTLTRGRGIHGKATLATSTMSPTPSSPRSQCAWSALPNICKNVGIERRKAAVRKETRVTAGIPMNESRVKSSHSNKYFPRTATTNEIPRAVPTTTRHVIRCR